MDKWMELYKRDLGNGIQKRFFYLLGFMVLFQSWFIMGSGSVEMVLAAGEMDYMAVVFSFNMFGSLVSLALTYDCISRERQNKVMDMILTSGLSKRMVIASKIFVNLTVSVLFAGMYVAVVALVYFALSGSVSVIWMCIPYIPALVAFIFLFCMLGLMLSIWFRSSKVSFIVSMIAGMVLMPRLYMLFLDGFAGVFHWGGRFVEVAGLASPALIMNALGARTGDMWIGIAFLAVYLVIMVSLSMRVFARQDEFNYGE